MQDYDVDKNGTTKIPEKKIILISVDEFYLFPLLGYFRTPIIDNWTCYIYSLDTEIISFKRKKTSTKHKN